MVIRGVKYPSDFEGKKAICKAAEFLHKRGYVIGGDGSLSVRTGPNAIWITVANADKAALDQNQLVRVDMNGKQAFNGNQVILPDNLAMHLRIYKENDSVRSVAHAYPPEIMALLLCGGRYSPATFTPSVRRLGELQSVESWEEFLNQPYVNCGGVLIKNDGCVFWGTESNEVIQKFEALEYYAKIRFRCMNAPVAVAPTPVVSAAPDNCGCREARREPSHRLNGVTEIIRPGASAVRQSEPQAISKGTSAQSQAADGRRLAMDTIVQRSIAKMNM